MIAKPGEYAGNDCIVAYARLAHVDIYVHQVRCVNWRAFQSGRVKPRCGKEADETGSDSGGRGNLYRAVIRLDLSTLLALRRRHCARPEVVLLLVESRVEALHNDTWRSTLLS